MQFGNSAELLDLKRARESSVYGRTYRVKGTHIPMQDESAILEGSLWRAVPRFALPVAATSILEQLSSLIDVVMVGHFSGEGGELGMAAVGANTPIMSLVINLFVGIALGANVVIANAVGRGDQDAVRKATHTSIAVVAGGILAAILLELVAEPLLMLLNVPADALSEATLFLRVYLIGLPSILLYNFEAAILRSVGITKPPLQALVVSAVLNVALDIVLVPVMGLGVAGIAAGTAVCYTVSAAILFVRLLRVDAPVRVRPREIGVDVASLAQIVRIGLPAGIQSAVFAVANIIIQTAINSLGTEVIAASSAALALEYVCYGLLNSFSQACTTFVGQNFGARNIGRCKKVLKVCLVEDGVVALVMICTVVALGRQLLALFNGDPDVIAVGYIRVCTIFPAYVFSMVYENVSGYLRGFGISTLPAVLTTLGVCGIRFFWVGVVFPADPTFQNIMMVYPVSLGVTAALIVAAALVARPSRSFASAVGERAEKGLTCR